MIREFHSMNYTSCKLLKHVHARLSCSSECIAKSKDQVPACDGYKEQQDLYRRSTSDEIIDRIGSYTIDPGASYNTLCSSLLR